MTFYRYPPFALHDCDKPLADLTRYDFVQKPAYYLAGLSPTPAMHLRGGVTEKLTSIQASLAPLLHFKN